MKKLVVTFGGIGLIPGVPGTYASFVAAIIFWCLWAWCGPVAFPVLLALMGAGAAAGYLLCPWAEAHFGRRDPSQFVLDEVVGQWVTLFPMFLLSLVLKPLGVRPLAHACAGFLMFRTLDVSKPLPIRRIEERPGGQGVMLDDVVAGLYAAAATICMVYVVRALVGAEMYDAC